MEDNIWNKLISVFKQTPEITVKKNTTAEFGSGVFRNLFTVSYNGEKNLGEIGPIRNYRIDYEALRLRSWQSYIESEITQTVIGRYSTWVIGRGLKLQAEPIKKILALENITVDIQDFSEAVEARFNLFRQSKLSSYSGMENLDVLAKTAHINAVVGGDVLVILRYENNQVTIQLVDGAHIQSPIYGSESSPEVLANGNKIINGIEINSKGEHVRYFVCTSDGKTTAVEAKGKETGLQMAFLVYGMRYRLDNVRGLPLISTVLETLKKLERYKEATVGSAEERQKIAYSIEHALGSSGENPLAKNLAKAFNADAGNDDIPIDELGKKLADTVAVSTNKQAFNLPTGSQLKLLESKNELHFKDFYSVNIDLICAALGIPPNVAMSKYDSNFSASRAALKDWEHTLNVKRHEFSFMFYQPIYNFWLEIEILKNKILAPGYLTAKITNENSVLDAYRNARFVGVGVPHIDPLKEVKAEREKLGATAINLPLTTLEQATESLNGGDSDSNMEQYAAELAESRKLNIVTEVAEVKESDTDTEVELEKE